MAGIARSLFAGAVAFLIGGGLLVAVLAALATGVIWTVARWMRKHEVPMFFQQMVGATIVTLSATTLAWTGTLEDSPAFVIAAGIVVLLSGLSLVGLVQDAISGFPLTAAGRAVEVVLASAGLLVGVVVSIKLVATVLGTDAGAYAAVVPQSPAPSLHPISLLAAAAAGMLFALSAYAPLALAAARGARGRGGLGRLRAARHARRGRGRGRRARGGRTRARRDGPAPLTGYTPVGAGDRRDHAAPARPHDVPRVLAARVRRCGQSAVTILLALTFGLALAAGVSVGEQIGWPLQRLLRRVLPGETAEDRERDARRGRPRVF